MLIIHFHWQSFRKWYTDDSQAYENQIRLNYEDKYPRKKYFFHVPSTRAVWLDKKKWFQFRSMVVEDRCDKLVCLPGRKLPKSLELSLPISADLCRTLFLALVETREYIPLRMSEWWLSPVTCGPYMSKVNKKSYPFFPFPRNQT